MPQVTTNNRRLTNVKLPNGEYVQGIRKNKTDPSSSIEDLELNKKLTLAEVQVGQ